MTKSQIKLAWDRIIRETHKRPKLGERLKDKQISEFGVILLFAQVLLGKIESGENEAINNLVFTKTMNYYCKQVKKYV